MSKKVEKKKAGKKKAGNKVEELKWMVDFVCESATKCDELVHGYCKRYKKNGKCDGCPIGCILRTVEKKCGIVTTCKEIASHCTIANIFGASYSRKERA